MTKLYNIKCRYDESHTNKVLLNVLCNDCKRPLFKVRWFYHAIFLHMCVFLIGFIIGQFNNVWIPCLIIELMFGLYLYVLFRQEDSNLRFILLFVLAGSFPIVLLSKFDSFGSTELEMLRRMLIGFSALTPFLAFFIQWSNQGTWKDLPVIPIGFYLILIGLLTLGRIYIHILDTEFASQIDHIYLREILLMISVIYYIVLAVIKTIERKVSAPRKLIAPRENAAYWRTNVQKINPFLAIAQTVWNTLLSIYATIAIIFISASNFVLYITILASRWIFNFFLEFFYLIKEFGKFFLSVVTSFLKDFAFPCFLLFFMNYVLISLIQELAKYINTNSLNVFKMLSGLFLLHLAFVSYIWRVSDYDFKEVVQSITLTSVALGLLIFLYAWISAWELYFIAQYLPQSPFKSRGYFAQYGTIVFVTLAVVVFIWNRRLNKNKSVSAAK